MAGRGADEDEDEQDEIGLDLEDLDVVNPGRLQNGSQGKVQQVPEDPVH